MEGTPTQRKTLAERLRSDGTTSSSNIPASSEGTTKALPSETKRARLNNTKTDVILTIETLPDNTIKYVFRLLYTGVILGVVGMLCLVVIKLEYEKHLLGESVLIWNTAVASIGLLALGWSMSCLGYKLYIVISQKLKWFHHFLKQDDSALIGLPDVFLNLLFYLTPNVYLLVNKCGWNDDILLWMGFGRMTCWNTLFLEFLVSSHNTNFIKSKEGEDDVIVFDLPFSVHAPKLLIWLGLEGFLIGILVRGLQSEPNSEHGQCTGDDFDCGLDSEMKKLTYAVAFFFLLYFFLSIVFFRIGFNQLKEKQYLYHRMTNIQVRLQSRMQTVIHAFHTMSLLLLWFINIGSCSSLILSWLGLLPSQFSVSLAIFARSFLMKPVKPTKEDNAIEMWLREFAWSEEEVPAIIEKRGNGDCSKTAPIFCFEKAVKTFYWSAFIYDYKQVENSSFSLKTAMRLYKLTDYRLFHEELHDTKLMVAWSDSMILLAFRGTSSLKNVFADLRISRAIHPPERGGFFSTPRVHRGFLETWRSNGLNVRVLELVNNLRKGKNQKVICTGHSLGGALATLAAYDIKFYCSVPPYSIDCYTFGAPRVGNYAFAYDYGRQVPNTWHVINDQDYITRTMKFVMLYKRPGSRVIINSQGDMLVRPSFIEMTLSRKTGAVNIVHHFLASYQKALIAIATSQFNQDGIEGGAEEMLKISETLTQVLGVSKSRLIQELSWGDRIKKLSKQKELENNFFYHFKKASGFVIEFGSDFVTSVKLALQSITKWIKCGSYMSRMQGVDPATTGACGTQICQAKELELRKSGGLGTETGHFSLLSQSSESCQRLQAYSNRSIQGEEVEEERTKDVD